MAWALGSSYHGVFTPYRTSQTMQGLSTSAQNKLSLQGCPAAWPCFCDAGVRSSCYNSLIPWSPQALPTSDFSSPVKQNLDHLENISACQCGPVVRAHQRGKLPVPGISTAPISQIFSLPQMLLPQPPCQTSSAPSSLSPWFPLVRSWDHQQPSTLPPSCSLCLP